MINSINQTILDQGEGTKALFEELESADNLQGKDISAEIIRVIPELIQGESPSRMTKNIVNIQELHIHYHSEEKEKSSPEKNKSSDLTRKVIQKIKDAVPFFSGASTNSKEINQELECSIELPSTETQPSGERKKKRDEVIQKIAIFAFGFLVGSVISICAIAGSKALLQGALTFSAIVGIVKCSSAIIREIGSVIAVAQNTLNILLDEI